MRQGSKILATPKRSSSAKPKPPQRWRISTNCCVNSTAFVRRSRIPDDLISCTLGFDGRLLEVRIADAIGHVMDNLELEKRINGLFAAGTKGVDGMRADLL